MRRYYVGVLTLLAPLGACQDPLPPPPPAVPPIVVVEPLAQWSGGALRVRVSGGDSIRPVIQAGGADTLPLTRIDDSTFASVLPVGPSGSVSLALLFGGRSYPIGQVARVGFQAFSRVTPGFYGALRVSHQGDAPMVIGAQTPVGAYGMVQTLNLATGAVTEFPGIFGNLYYGVSPTPQPNEFIVADTGRNPVRWRLWGTPGFVETVPGVYTRQVASLTDSVLLRTTSQQTSTVRAGVIALTVPTNDVWSVFLSPTGDLATVAQASGNLGVPVFRTATGDTAYMISRAFSHIVWAAFSSDGSQLYLLGGRNASLQDSLVALRAATGQFVAGRKVTGGAGFNLAADPVRSLIYAEVLDTSGVPKIQVLNAATLELVAELAAPADPSTPRCQLTCFEGVLAVDRVRNKLHAVWPNDLQGGGTVVFTFDLLP